MGLRGIRARVRGESESNDRPNARLPERPIGRYVLALVLIALLAVLSTFTTYQALSSQEKDATVLEYGLRQGYLASRVADLSGQVVDGVSEPIREEMTAALDEIVRVHESFVNGDPDLDFPPMEEAAIVALLTVAYVTINFLVDGLYTLLDPRIRHG